MGWGAEPTSLPLSAGGPGAVRGDWAGAFCRQLAGIYLSQLEKLGGCVPHTPHEHCFERDGVLLQPLPPDPGGPPSILLRAPHEAPAVAEVFPCHTGGDTGGRTLAPQAPLAKQTLSPL